MKRNKLTMKYAKEAVHDAWKKLDTDLSYHNFLHYVKIDIDDDIVEFSVDGSSIKLKLSQAKIDALKKYKERLYAERERDIG